MGLLSYGTGMLLIAFAGHGWMIYLYMIPYCFGGISGPALQGMITSKFAKNEQGELQGGLALLSSLSLIIGPILMGYTFNIFTIKGSAAYFPGAPYILGALLMFISTLLAAISIKSLANQDR